MSDGLIKPKNYNEAHDMAERLWYEMHRDNHSLKWYSEQLESLEFFSEDEIWEFLQMSH